ncbi:VacJ family lipoprotein [Reinekea sp. G2M2-21]|uniref:MlaA family lipoprotein n=1 Tax=Reinekea sp. G2M2-21 TaxID=2788942 RepID=UPI0018ABDB24|nr:VacJ family lipoprotein [Reinekea sp. G2M2-21]
MDKRSPIGLIYSASLLLSFCFNLAIASDDDPLEPVNRVVFTVNDTVDTVVLRPMAKVYQAVMPEFAERGVRNFFSNLGEVRNAVHNTLQGKLDGTARSTGRFLINTTVGIGGLFDVASKIGIDAAREDLGQTLGVWGLNSGPYLVLPILGPSSLRDGVGVVVDPFMSPLTYAPLDVPKRLAVGLTSGLQTRADLLSAEGLLSGDKYTLYRQAYLSKREYDVNDGLILNDEFIEDDPVEVFEGEDFLDEAF